MQQCKCVLLRSWWARRTLSLKNSLAVGFFSVDAALLQYKPGVELIVAWCEPLTFFRVLSRLVKTASYTGKMWSNTTERSVWALLMQKSETFCIHTSLKLIGVPSRGLVSCLTSCCWGERSRNVWKDARPENDPETWLFFHSSLPLPKRLFLLLLLLTIPATPGSASTLPL